MTPTLRIATRGSRLALWQTEHVTASVAASSPDARVVVTEVRTTGDVIRDAPLAQLSGSAFFTREIEAALLAGEADAAVHSLKDLASTDPSGLTLAAVLEREDPRDALITRSGQGLDELPAGSRVGTSSVRRKAFLRWARPDLEPVELRGNVPTRVAKLDGGKYDAILLAAAGLIRLGMEARIAEFLEPHRFVPPAGQGAIAVQVRAADGGTAELLRSLDHADTRRAVEAERAFLAELSAGCQAPVGVHGRIQDGTLVLWAAVVAVDGSRRVEARLESLDLPSADAGTRLAGLILERGGGEILESAEREAGT